MKLYLGCMACIMVLVGCGGDSNSSKKISELTDEEAGNWCKSHIADFEQVAKSSCIFEGLDMDNEQKCETARSACQAEANSDTSSVECESADVSDLGNCEATVGEFENCLHQLVKYMDNITCAMISGPISATPTCYTTLSSKCPSMFGADSDTSAITVGK
jgi:hypothetical protein